MRSRDVMFLKAANSLNSHIWYKTSDIQIGRYGFISFLMLWIAHFTGPIYNSRIVEACKTEIVHKKGNVALLK